jgi:hypothetical protein
MFHLSYASVLQQISASQCLVLVLEGIEHQLSRVVFSKHEYVSSDCLLDDRQQLKITRT